MNSAPVFDASNVRAISVVRYFYVVLSAEQKLKIKLNIFIFYVKND